MEFGKVERVSLPKMFVASYEVVSEAPEEDAQEFVENWLKDKGLKVGENGARGFGFDCHKGRDIPAGCRIYHVYYSVPENVKGDSNVEVKEFSGGNFAKLTVEEPFTGDFPLGWGILLKWTFDQGEENLLGCTSPDDCYSLFSNEESPCLEEIFYENGKQYMNLFLPIR